MLSLFGGEVRVVAVPGNRFAMASMSMVLSGAIVVSCQFSDQSEAESGAM